MSKNPAGFLVTCFTTEMCGFTVLTRSSDVILSRSRFEATLLPLITAEGGGSVIRLHCTPCLAQLVHGLSSSHC